MRGNKMRNVWISLAGGLFLLLGSGLGRAGAPEEALKNILPHGGFEELGQQLGEEAVLVEEGEFKGQGGWNFKVSEGKARYSADFNEKTEGKASLKIELLDKDKDTEFELSITVPDVKPDYIYELRAMVRCRNVNWTMSQYRPYEYDAKGKRSLQTIQRLVDESDITEFTLQTSPFVTGPTVDHLNLQIYWKGRPKIKGIVRRPAIVWMDDVRLLELGPFYPPTGEYLEDDFEAEELQNWLMTQPGGGRGSQKDPGVSSERAHGGEKSLKFTDTWGMIERVYARPLTDCAVTVWFYDDLGKGSGRVRMAMLSGEGNKRAGLGTDRISTTHYCAFLGYEAQATGLKRSTGWHEFKFDCTGGQGVRLYIDGKQVAETDVIDRFRILRLGQNSWGGFTCYMDDVSIRFKKQQ